MIIDGTNISTFGMTLLQDPGILNLPKRKTILDIPAFTANDLKFESFKGNIVLLGQWTSASAMETGLANFETLIKSAVKHTIEFDEYLFPEITEAVFPNGYKVEPIRTLAKITMKVVFANQKGIVG